MCYKAASNIRVVSSHSRVKSPTFAVSRQYCSENGRSKYICTGSFQVFYILLRSHSVLPMAQLIRVDDTIQSGMCSSYSLNRISNRETIKNAVFVRMAEEHQKQGTHKLPHSENIGLATSSLPYWLL